MTKVSIATITLKTNRPDQVARFWRDLLGYQVAANHSDSVMLVGADGPGLLIQPSVEPHPAGAIHLDLRPDDQRACVHRAIELGAVPADIGQTGQESWVVLADPGGNLFCVLQSHADYNAVLPFDPGARTPLP